MVSKKKAKKKARAKKRKPIIVDIDKDNPNLAAMASYFKVPKKSIAEMFSVSVRGDGQVNCLVKALADDDPHQFGHLIGSVILTHAKIFVKHFGLERNETVARMLDGVVHELADILRDAQRQRFDEAERIMGERAPAVDAPDLGGRPRGRKVH